MTLRSALRAVGSGMSIRNAVKQFGIPRTTLRDRLKTNDYEKPKLGKKTVFSDDFEDELSERIIHVANMFYGITTEKLAALAYEFAERQGIEHPFKNGRAGPDWIAGFLRRHPEISVRKPESISLARLEGVNKQNMQNFYENIKGLMRENGPYPCHRIYNVDETGVAPYGQQSERPGCQGATQEGAGCDGRAGKTDDSYRLRQRFRRLHPADADFRRQEAHGSCSAEWCTGRPDWRRQ